MPCVMELPVSMETGDSESPAARSAAVTAVTAGMTAEPCLTPDTAMEDRGVDLSFDTTEPGPRVRVKPELDLRTDKLVMGPSETQITQAVRDQIKQECDNSQAAAVKPESPHILQSPGGRLKIFQSKYTVCFFLTAFLDKVPSFITTTMMQMLFRGDW